MIGNSIIRKYVALGIILLFLGVVVAPSINYIIVKASATVYSRNNYNSYGYQRKISSEDLTFQKKWSLDCNFDITTLVNFSDNYTSHSPIYIEHNGDFTEENGVIGGNGTIQNPYIIAGWDIDSLGEYVDGIKIAGTTKYFIITNCSIHTSNTNGIFLYGSSNGTIENCIITNNV